MTAGIAAADVSVSGSFKLGFNDTQSNHVANDSISAVARGEAANAIVAEIKAGYTTNAATGAVTANVVTAGSDTYTPATTSDNNYGIYNDAGITFAMSSTMDSGMTAGVTVDMNGGDTTNNAVDSYTLALASDGLNVTFGTTEYSAITNWKSAGDMGTDTWANQNADNKNVLRADVTLGGLAVSAGTSVTTGEKAAPDAVSITVGGSLGGASYVIASEGPKMGVSVTNAIGGATLTTAYSTAPSVVTTGTGYNAVNTAHATSMNTSTGVKISYPAGAVTTTASYVMESNGTGQTTALADSWNVSAAWTSGATSVTFSTDEASANKVEGSTTLGAGVTVAAGLADAFEDMYLAVTTDLGGGASILASYAVDGGGDAGDEVGAGDWQEGLTVELKFAF
jgi:hypothetical protein